MNMTLIAQPLTAKAFAPFGDVLEAVGTPDKVINQGLCGRFHNRATLDFGPGGQAGISVFQGEARAWPITTAMVERHPEGSQAFISMTGHPFLVVVAPDANGKLGAPLAFVAAPGQGINFHRNTWHGVLTPLHAPGLFAVMDRIGDTPNLEEYWFDTPYLVEPGDECTRAGLV